MPLRNDLLNPIPGDNPSGANLRYDPISDKIKEARREDIDVPQGQWKTALKVADYAAVVKLGGDVLANRSKDLQIAVWLVDAHVRREGFGILAPAFTFLRDLVDQFWDTLYPPIDEDGDMEVRATPLTWLGTKLGEPLGFLPIVSGKLSWLKYQESRKVGFEADANNYEKQQAREAAIAEGKITGEQFDEAAAATSVAKLKETYQQLTSAQEALDSLSEFCDEKFGDYAPSFIKTREAIEEIAQTVRIILSRKPGGLDEPEPEPEPEAEPEPEIAEEAPAEEESASFEEESVSMDSTSLEEAVGGEEPSFAEGADSYEGSESSGVVFGEPASMEDVKTQLASICRFLRQQNPEDPTPYLIVRAFAWAPLMNHPNSIDYSMIEAPPSDLRVNVRKLAKESEWDQVLDLTEEAMLEPSGRAWLDMQRYAVQAIEQKGFPSTGKVVTNQMRTLLEMVPDLRTVTLPDDTPAGNPETQNWIENFVIIRTGPPPEPKSEEGESGESSESSDFGGSSDFGSTDDSSSFSTDDTSSTDTSMDMSMESTPEPEAEAAPEPEPEPEPEPIPEPEPYEVEENPPIMEAEEPPPSDISDEFGQALEAVRDGRVAEGLAIITAILATERSGRARFRRRTQLAHLLMAAGKGKVAHPMLEQLATEIEERRLEDWEQSEAIAYPLELLLHCLSPADDERRTQLYTRICRLDPVRAVNCSI